MDSPPVPTTKTHRRSRWVSTSHNQKATNLIISSSEIAALDHESADTGTEGTLRSNYRSLFMWKSCAHFLMIRWKPLSLYHKGFPDLPMPFSPVQSAPV